MVLPELTGHFGTVLDGLSVMDLPVLGARQPLVRRRSIRIEPGSAKCVVLEVLLAEVLEPGW